MDRGRTKMPDLEHEPQQEETSSDNDIDEKAFTFFPNGMTGKSTRFYLHAPTCPGQTEPYMLPHDVDICPIEGCPANQSGRVFKPHWRLNEHMKTRHGWPRRGSAAQRPFGSAFVPSSDRSLRHSRPRQDSMASRDSLSQSASKRKRMDDDHVNDINGTEPSPARPTRTRRQTEKGKAMATSTRPSRKAKATYPEPHEAQDQAYGTDSAMDIDSKSLSSPLSPQPPISEDTRDYELISSIKSLARELRTASAQNPELANAARENEELIEQDLVRVNCMINERQAALLPACYQRLADRHNARAMVFSMHSSHNPHKDYAAPRPTQAAQQVPQEEVQGQRKPTPPKEFRFIDDAPRQRRSKTNGFTAINGQGQEVTNPAAVNGTPKPQGPIMLKLRLPGKQ